MNANLSQLLKDLKEGSVYANILVSILGCALILYSVFLYFSHFFRGLSVYEQSISVLGYSLIYTGISIPLSCLSGLKYPGMFFLPIVILAISAGISVFMPQVGWTSIPGKNLLYLLLPLVSGLVILFGITHMLIESKRQKSKP